MLFILRLCFIDQSETIKVKQELENGWFQWSELDFPTSLTIQSGINSPRYATAVGLINYGLENWKEEKYIYNDTLISIIKEFFNY